MKVMLLIMIAGLLGESGQCGEVTVCVAGVPVVPLQVLRQALEFPASDGQLARDYQFAMRKRGDGLAPALVSSRRFPI